MHASPFEGVQVYTPLLRNQVFDDDWTMSSTPSRTGEYTPLLRNQVFAQQVSAHAPLARTQQTTAVHPVLIAATQCYVRQRKEVDRINMATAF
jgi:hypothetical protein